MNIKILFEDDYLLVIDKPSGMIVNRSDTTKGEKTLQDFVEEYLKITNTNVQNDFEFTNRAGIAHRLDKETSGIILVAKTHDSFENLQKQFKERKVKKTYLALAHGKIEPKIGEINVSVGRLPWNRKRFGVLSGGREAVTEYKTIKNFRSTVNHEPLTLVELNPKTGRTHQIRVHLQYIKHPIFADPLYAGRKTGRNDRKLLSRVFLHASKISFSHPGKNEIVSFKSPLPEELKDFLSGLAV